MRSVPMAGAGRAAAGAGLARPLLTSGVLAALLAVFPGMGCAERGAARFHLDPLDPGPERLQVGEPRVEPAGAGRVEITLSVERSGGRPLTEELAVEWKVAGGPAFTPVWARGAGPSPSGGEAAPGAREVRFTIPEPAGDPV